jgi:hypothetical protein
MYSLYSAPKLAISHSSVALPHITSDEVHLTCLLHVKLVYLTNIFMVLEFEYSSSVEKKRNLYPVPVRFTKFKDVSRWCDTACYATLLDFVRCHNLYITDVQRAGRLNTVSHESLRYRTEHNRSFYHTRWRNTDWSGDHRMNDFSFPEDTSVCRQDVLTFNRLAKWTPYRNHIVW